MTDRQINRETGRQIVIGGWREMQNHKKFGIKTCKTQTCHLTTRGYLKCTTICIFCEVLIKKESFKLILCSKLNRRWYSWISCGKQLNALSCGSCICCGVNLFMVQTFSNQFYLFIFHCFNYR